MCGVDIVNLIWEPCLQFCDYSVHVSLSHNKLFAVCFGAVILAHERTYVCIFSALIIFKTFFFWVMRKVHDFFFLLKEFSSPPYAFLFIVYYFLIFLYLQLSRTSSLVDLFMFLCYPLLSSLQHEAIIDFNVIVILCQWKRFPFLWIVFKFWNYFVMCVRTCHFNI